MYLFHPGNTLSTSQKQAPRSTYKGLWNHCDREPFTRAFHRVKSEKRALRSSILASASPISRVTSCQLLWRQYFFWELASLLCSSCSLSLMPAPLTSQGHPLWRCPHWVQFEPYLENAHQSCAFGSRKSQTWI